MAKHFSLDKQTEVASKQKHVATGALPHPVYLSPNAERDVYMTWVGKHLCFPGLLLCPNVEQDSLFEECFIF